MPQLTSTTKVSKSTSTTEALLDVTDKSAVHATRFLKEMHDRKEIKGKTSGERSQQSTLTASADDPNSGQESRPFTTASGALPKSTKRSLKADLSLLSSVISTSSSENAGGLVGVLDTVEDG
jgi:hypothetical protein